LGHADRRLSQLVALKRARIQDLYYFSTVSRGLTELPWFYAGLQIASYFGEKYTASQSVSRYAALPMGRNSDSSVKRAFSKHESRRRSICSYAKLVGLGNFTEPHVRRYNVHDKADADELGRLISRLCQSGNINFLFGSGASTPAIPLATSVEDQIRELIKTGQTAEAYSRMHDFLWSVQGPTNRLINNTPDADIDGVVATYADCLASIGRILTERATTLLPAQANIFTTNYDLLIEKASEAHSTIRLNDGFVRTPSIAGRITYSAQGFFDTTFNRGPFYSYKVEIPCVNLIKLHGSLSWKRDGHTMLCNIAPRDDVTDVADETLISEFVASYAVVLPRTQKFEETLLEGLYYDLLRIYANQLDKENTVLISLGFSFNDDHIFTITKRALENPTLRLLVFASSAGGADKLSARFATYGNVDVVGPAAGQRVVLKDLVDRLRSYVPDRQKLR
jgi:hypothetical protein